MDCVWDAAASSLKWWRTGGLQFPIRSGHHKQGRAYCNKRGIFCAMMRGSCVHSLMCLAPLAIPAQVPTRKSPAHAFTHKGARLIRHVTP